MRVIRRVLGASRAGDGHIAVGVGCQDAFGWFVGDSITAIAVADGAGSRPQSATGSAYAVNRALRYVELRGTADEHAVVDACFGYPRQGLAEYAAEWNLPVEHLGTTLAVVVMTEEMTYCGQVGDSIVVLGIASDSEFHLIHPEEKGEFVNETFFITDGDFRENLRLSTYPSRDVSSIFLSTDGLRYKILDIKAQAAHTPFFQDTAAYVRGPGSSSDGVERYLRKLDNLQCDDDLTLVAAVFGEPESRWRPAPYANAVGFADRSLLGERANGPLEGLPGHPGA